MRFAAMRPIVATVFSSSGEEQGMSTKTGLFCAMALALALGIGAIGVADNAPMAFAADSGLQAAQLDESGPSVQTQAATKSAKPAKPSKKQLKSFRKASADFSLELFKKSVEAKGKNANVTISPMSVMYALAITANGAGGKTAKQMRKVLGDGASMARINKNLAWYNSSLKNVEKAKLLNANSVWYHNGGSLIMKPKFLAKAKKHYSAQVNGADFSAPKTVNLINSWVAENTNGMIKQVVDRLSDDDRVAIINALYFDAEWKAPFESGDVRTERFTNANGKKRKVKMMHGTEYRYIEGDNVTGFIKPYAKGYSYVALLPRKGIDARQYAMSLDGDTFRKLVAKAKRKTVRIALPKYSLSYTNDSMERQLQDMGIELAFSDAANFKNMGTDRTGKLSLDRVIHKTKIDLDEQGTRAAAVTAVFAKASSAMIDVKYVTLNRPFVYAIIDNTNKLPVFIGTVSNIGK